METLLALVIGISVLLFFMRGYLKGFQKRETEAQASLEKGELYSEGPRAQHPHIDVTHCIGCAACTTVCPEGDVLAMLGGKAVIANGHKCIGHSLCADACPTGAITMVMASPTLSADMPVLTPDYETSVANLFIVGELGGLALIKNAVNQGRDCVDTIADRLAVNGSGKLPSDVLDVLIVGAGPAGISASLRAVERKLRYLTVERDQVGGTVAKFPRQKLVMTSPVEFPIYGKFKKMELSKEELLAFWNKILQRVDFNVRPGESVEDVRKDSDHVFEVVTAKNTYRSRAVILGLGRAGTPRKLGVPGEDLPKVMYRLIEADHYVNKKILVVGGGDSAVEAAIGLSKQPGNKVTLSYRKDAFRRIKERNAQRIQECIRTRKVNVLFNSVPTEFNPSSVVLDVQGTRKEIPNDFSWVFAGGDPPTAFLKKIGVKFGNQDMTLEASREAKSTASVAPPRAPAAPVSVPAETSAERSEAKTSPVKVGGKHAAAVSQRRGTPRPLGIPGESLDKVAYAPTEAERYNDADVFVAGGGDSAIEAALALSRSGRNRVTVACRGDEFICLDEHHREQFETAEREGRLTVLRKTNLLGVKPEAVLLDCDGKLKELRNQYVFVLIGETSPEQFLQEAGAEIEKELSPQAR
jgi:putative YpdA family bacillithiol system oxidoreductase